MRNPHQINMITRRVVKSDNLTKTDVPDSERVSLKQPWEVKNWRAEFGSTHVDLEKAVEKVGDSMAAVKNELGE